MRLDEGLGMCRGGVGEVLVPRMGRGVEYELHVAHGVDDDGEVGLLAVILRVTHPGDGVPGPDGTDLGAESRVEADGCRADTVQSLLIMIQFPSGSHMREDNTPLLITNENFLKMMKGE